MKIVNVRGAIQSIVEQAVSDLGDWGAFEVVVVVHYGGKPNNLDAICLDDSEPPPGEKQEYWQATKDGRVIALSTMEKYLQLNTARIPGVEVSSVQLDKSSVVSFIATTVDSQIVGPHLREI